LVVLVMESPLTARDEMLGRHARMRYSVDIRRGEAGGQLARGPEFSVRKPD